VRSAPLLSPQYQRPTPRQAGLVMTDLAVTTRLHDKDTVMDFLTALDPSADKFTFQFFSDGAWCRREAAGFSSDWCGVLTLGPRPCIGRPRKHGAAEAAHE